MTPTITRSPVTVVGGALGPFSVKELRILNSVLEAFVIENDTEASREAAKVAGANTEKDHADQIAVARQGIQYFREVADNAAGVGGSF